MKNWKKKLVHVAHKLFMMCKEQKMVPIPAPINTDALLQGKVALITGGSGGIGFAMGQAFLRHGAKVILAGTNEERLQSYIHRLSSEMENPCARSLLINVLDTASLPDKVAKAAALFPENRIDILVNSAGVVAHSGFLEMSEQEYDSIMDVNAKGAFFMSQAVSKFMIENQVKGHILNVTSSSALRPAWGPYQMSKWAVRGFTLGLADTLLPYGIVVNAIAPGPTATPMLGKREGDSICNVESPCGRYAMPSEIAELAAFMVSGMGDLIVGDTFYMTGGSGTITYHH